MNSSNNNQSNNNDLYSLHNVSNYNTTMNYNINEILNKSKLLIIEYLKLFNEKVNLKNTEYNKFILIRGLETISNVFNQILYYSKNMDMAFYHGQKAFYFYVEFIGQISEDQHTFLQLSSRDATLYVYKKTIFEINTEYKKKIELSFQQEEKQKHFLLNKYVQIYKILFSKFLDFYIDFLFNKENEKDEEFGKKQVLQEFEKLCKYINNSNFSENDLEILPLHLNKFINIYIGCGYEGNHFFKSIIDVIKQMKKNKL